MATVSSQYNLAINVGGKADTKHLDQSQSKLQSFGKGVDKVIGGLKNAAVAAVAVGATFQKAFELSKEGAQLNQLTESFERMNKEVFHTPDLLDRMSEAARGTIKETDLMSGLLTLTAGASDEMAQRFAEAAPRLLEIAKASNKLNPALGDTAFLYDSISKGIKRQSPLILDNLGLVVKIGEANEKYAASIGKNVEQLTAEEKQIALLNATMEAGDNLINQVGGDVSSQADAWAQLEVRIGETTDSFKQFLAEGLNPVISAVGGGYNTAADNIVQKNIEMAKSIDDLVKQGQRLTETQNMFGGLATAVTGTSKAVADGRAETIKAIAAQAKSFEEYESAISSAFGSVTESAAPARTALEGMGFDTAKLNKEGKSWVEVLYEQGQALQAGSEAIDGWLIGAKDLRDTTEALSQAAEYNDIQYRALVASTGNLTDTTEEYGVTAAQLKEIEEQRNATIEEQERATQAAAAATAALDAKTGDYFASMAAGNVITESAIPLYERIAAQLNEIDGDHHFSVSYNGLDEALAKARALAGTLGGLGSVNDMPDPFAGTPEARQPSGNVPQRGDEQDRNLPGNNRPGRPGAHNPGGAFASGVSGFVVPPGFPNDSFMVGVTSGEVLDVTPPNKRGGGRIVIENINIKIDGSRLRGTRDTAQAVASQVATLIGNIN